MPKVLESLGLGVMEYWSVEKKDIHPFVITPVLQPVAPKSHLSVTKGDTPKLIEIDSCQDGIPSFGLQIC